MTKARTYGIWLFWFNERREPGVAATDVSAKPKGSGLFVVGADDQPVEFETVEQAAQYAEQMDLRDDVWQVREITDDLRPQVPGNARPATNKGVNE